MANELHALGLLTRIDRSSLAGYCQCYADWAEAEEQIRRFGKVIKSPVREITRTMKNGQVVVEKSGGFPMQSPFVAIRNKALEMMLKFATEFGLTPSSRSRVSIKGKSDGDDPSAKYF